MSDVNLRHFLLTTSIRLVRLMWSRWGFTKTEVLATCDPVCLEHDIQKYAPLYSFLSFVLLEGMLSRDLAALDSLTLRLHSINCGKRIHISFARLWYVMEP